MSWRINTNTMFRLHRALAAQNDLEQSTQILEPVVDAGFSLSASVCIRRWLYALEHSDSRFESIHRFILSESIRIDSFC